MPTISTTPMRNFRLLTCSLLATLIVSVASAREQFYSVTSSEVNPTSSTIRLKVEPANTPDQSAIPDFGFDVSQNGEPSGAINSDRFVRWVVIPPQSGVELQSQNLTSEITDSKSIEEANSLPTQFAELGSPAIMRGYRLVPIYLSRYIRDENSGAVKELTGGEVELNFDTEQNRVNLVGNSRSKVTSRYVRKIIENFVINPQDLNRDDPVEAGSILYVMRNRDDIEEHLQPLIDWRRRMGWTVQVARVSQNENRVAVKNAIQNVYDNSDYPPEYVVLVGDAPGRRNNAFTLAFFNEQNGANYAYETDQEYVLLEGDDLLPEAAIGRFTINSLVLLDRFVEKIISYEKTPFIGGNASNRNWQLKAAVAATDSRSGRSSIDICKWFKNMLIANNYIQVNELYFNDQQQQPNPTNFLTTNIQAGLSFVLYRGWADMNGYEPDNAAQLRNGQALPFVMLATCNTGEYALGNQNSEWTYTERFVTNALGGAIGSVGAAGATHTSYNNLLAAGTLSAQFINGIYSQGWMLQNGKVQLMHAYQGLGDINHEENNGMEAWLTEYFIFNLIGDPAVDLFTAVPMQLRVTHTPLNVGTTHFSAIVANTDGEPVTNARVCLNKPGDFQIVGMTDDNGRAEFVLEYDWTTYGIIELTVTGHNLLTSLEDINLDRSEHSIVFRSLVINDDNNGESRGNNDGRANPGERLELTATLRNVGVSTPEGGVRVTPGSLNHLATVLSDPVGLEVAPNRDQSVDVHFVVEVNEAAPNGGELNFQISVEVDNEELLSRFSVPVIANQIELNSFIWSGDPIRVGGDGSFWVVVENESFGNVPRLTTDLISLTPTVFIVNGEVEIPAFNANQTSRSTGILGITASSRHIAGNPANFSMVVSAESGFEDTVFFSIPIGQATASTPFGPDNYGYICIDDTDTGWSSNVNYDWIEINPRLQGEGTDLQLTDLEEEGDASVAVDLPFSFTYYGENFDQITVCSNGWAAFGDHHELIGARNRRIPSGELIPAMMAPFWDDLITTDSGGVYVFDDEENDRFIIEWSKMRKLGPDDDQEPLETFQIILFTSEDRRGNRGDGDILFQYNEVTETQSCFQRYDTPFATVGIASPSRDDGLEYSYWHQLHPGAAPLENGRAILFTTILGLPEVHFEGVVTDYMTNTPIEGAIIRSQGGIAAQTDENGYYFLTLPMSDEEISLTASRQYFCDSLRTGFEFGVDDTVTANFNLLKPLFTIDKDSLYIECQEELTIRDTLTISNSGSGKMHFFISRESLSGSLGYNRAVKNSLGESEISGEWLVYSPEEDTIEAGDSRHIVITIIPTSLDTGIYHALLVIDHNASPGRIEILIELKLILDVPNDEIDLKEFGLESVFPNPFNSTAMIRYNLNQPSVVSLAVYSPDGRLIEHLVKDEMSSCKHQVQWAGHGFGSGLYIVKLDAGNLSSVQKVLLVR